MEVVWEISDPHCQEITGDNYLLSYTLRQGDRVTRRVAIWQRTNEGWRAFYHQGTVVA